MPNPWSSNFPSKATRSKIVTSDTLLRSSLRTVAHWTCILSVCLRFLLLYCDSAESHSKYTRPDIFLVWTGRYASSIQSNCQKHKCRFMQAEKVNKNLNSVSCHAMCTWPERYVDVSYPIHGAHLRWIKCFVELIHQVVSTSCLNKNPFGEPNFSSQFNKS